MLTKLALKRLTASDLTFFEWHFKNRQAGNQKAINLNANVFTDQLYPALSALRRDRNNQLGIDLWITGPGTAPPLNLQRKIVKGTSYKNWRLDGEFVHNPEGAPKRFNVLEPGDLAVFGFDGDLEPDTVTLLLVAQGVQEDTALFHGLHGLLKDDSMIVLENDSLRGLCVSLTISQDHPVWQLVSDDDLVEAASGQAPALERLLKRGRAAYLSPQALRKAKRAAEEIGQLGEELFDYYLRTRLSAQEISDYTWVSAVNAVAPYDFRVLAGNSWEKFEVKTTSGSFNREYYLPLSELREMARKEGAYRIVRIYDASPDGAKARLSHELHAYGRSIIAALAGLPEGVTPNGVTIVPDALMFGDEFAISVAPDDEE